MRSSLRVFATAFLLFFILMANVSDMGGPVGAEARTCESQSHRFKGPCISRTNCASVCKTEGFPGGRCRGFRRRCFCLKHC